MSATFISSLLNAAFLWCLSVVFVPFETFVHVGMAHLAIAGLFAPCLARVFLYTGIEKVGVSIAEPINGTSPFFAAIAALLFLNERLTVSIGIATLLTVLGVILLGSSGPQNSQTSTQTQWRKRDLGFPFIAALIYGVSRIFRKLGMTAVASPLGGATVIATISLLFFAALLPLTQKAQEIRLEKRSFILFALAGIFGALGQAFTLAALRRGDVVVVSPLSATTVPLFALCLTYIFLKRLERVTRRVVISALFIVAGVLILTATS